MASRYIANTADEQKRMLAVIGAGSIEELLVKIPAKVRLPRPLGLVPAMAETELIRHLKALAGKNAVMPAIIRIADKPYRWKIAEAPLTEIANREKMLPRTFITTDGFGITGKARAYLAPLIKGEAPPPFKDGLPRYVRLKNVPVTKKLATGFKI